MSTETLIAIFLTNLATFLVTLLAFYLKWRFTERINQIRCNLSALIFFKTILEHDDSIIVPIVNEKRISKDKMLHPFIPLNLSMSITEFGNTLCLLPNLGTRLCRHLLYREYLATLETGITKEQLIEYIEKENDIIADINLAIEREMQREQELFLVAVYHGIFDARRY